jgi:hypothetical protein
MTLKLDLWDTFQSENLNHEEWTRQITETAASLQSSFPTEELRAGAVYGTSHFRHFEEWQREVDGDVAMPLNNSTEDSALKEPQNTNHSSFSSSALTKTVSSEDEATMQGTYDNDTDIEDAYSTSYLYHQTLTKRRIPRPLHGRKVDSLAGRQAWGSKDVRKAKDVKEQNEGGQQRRERKIRYRLMGAFHKVRSILSGETTLTRNTPPANHFRFPKAVGQTISGRDC